jgi:RNA polymerase sigma-70 factor (ECF subfamily)
MPLFSERAQPRRFFPVLIRVERSAAMDDAAIIDLYWKREESAIAATHEKYGAYCFAIAHRILTSREDADECVNDTWLRAWNAMPPERPNLLSAFLGRITRNLALDRYRASHAVRRGGALADIDLELEECADQRTPDQALDAMVTGQAISRFLEGCDQATRVVFLRRYWYADSIGDIAKRYHISESKVKSMLFRCRNKLRRYLEQEGIWG